VKNRNNYKNTLLKKKALINSKPLARKIQHTSSTQNETRKMSDVDCEKEGTKTTVESTVGDYMVEEAR
jgi:hypothetical protein